MDFLMAIFYTILGFIGVWIAIVVIAIAVDSAKSKGKSPEELRREVESLRAENDRMTYGPINRSMVCPHCSTTGKVHTKPVVQKKGISGGKATAALFTGGISMVATGLSRKESHTQAHCSNCNNTWVF